MLEVSLQRRIFWNKYNQMAFKLKNLFGSGGSGNSTLRDEAEQQRYLELERLHASTRAAKHFQRDVVKAVEGIISTGAKQLEVTTKLAEDCRKYGSEAPSGITEALSRATLQYSSARNRMDTERDNMHRALAAQVSEPLKTMVAGSPLVDARHLKQKYDRLHESADAQAAEVNRRRSKEGGGNSDNAAKLQSAEQKLDQITAAMNTMGTSAIFAMNKVESQQQTVTLHRMLAMVEAERAYFQTVCSVLDQLHADIQSEVSMAPAESSSVATAPPTPPRSSSGNGRREPYEEDPPEIFQRTKNVADDDKAPVTPEFQSYKAIVTMDHDGVDEGELTISVGDEVLVRHEDPSGWSEGVCNGNEGWFPSSYVERRNPERRRRRRQASGSSNGSR